MASESDRIRHTMVPEPDPRYGTVSDPDPRYGTASEPDRIRHEIEATRAELAANVDQLADRTSPTRVVRRNWNRLTDKMHTFSDTVMGKPANTVKQYATQAGGKVSEAGEKVSQVASEAGEKVSEVASDAAEAVREVPHKAAEQTRGNPIAAGMIAFGAGLLAATLIPETEVERRMSRKLADSELVERAREPLMDSAEHVRDDVTQTVKQSAVEVGESVKQHAAAATEEVRR